MGSFDEKVGGLVCRLIVRWPNTWWLSHFGRPSAWRQRRTYRGIRRTWRLIHAKKQLTRLVAWSRPGEYGPVEWMLDAAKEGLYEHAGWRKLSA